MWNCKSCETSIEDDSWTTCWKCSLDRNAAPTEVEEIRARIDKTMKCLRCENKMEYAGTKKFHEGSRLGVLGDLAELFVTRETYDVYFCTQCGKVEFYIDGIGDKEREETH
jgi:hypothetical protein